MWHTTTGLISFLQPIKNLRNGKKKVFPFSKSLEQKKKFREIYFDRTQLSKLNLFLVNNQGKLKVCVRLERKIILFGHQIQPTSKVVHQNRNGHGQKRNTHSNVRNQTKPNQKKWPIKYHTTPKRKQNRIEIAETGPF